MVLTILPNLHHAPLMLLNFAGDFLPVSEGEIGFLLTGRKRDIINVLSLLAFSAGFNEPCNCDEKYGNKENGK
jgi:hypothetical protein